MLRFREWVPLRCWFGCAGIDVSPQVAGTINKTVLQFIKEGAGGALWWEAGGSGPAFRSQSELGWKERIAADGMMGGVGWAEGKGG